MHFILLFPSSKCLTGWLTISANFALSADIAFLTIFRSSSTVPGWVENLLRTVPCQIVSDHMVHSIFHLVLYHMSHPLLYFLFQSLEHYLYISPSLACHNSRASWDIFYWLGQPINQPINDQTGPRRPIRKPDSPINICNLWIDHLRYQIVNQAASGSAIYTCEQLVDRPCRKADSRSANSPEVVLSYWSPTLLCVHVL